MIVNIKVANKANKAKSHLCFEHKDFFTGEVDEFLEFCLKSMILRSVFFSFCRMLESGESMSILSMLPRDVK